MDATSLKLYLEISLISHNLHSEFDFESVVKLR